MTRSPSRNRKNDRWANIRAASFTLSVVCPKDEGWAVALDRRLRLILGCPGATSGRESWVLLSRRSLTARSKLSMSWKSRYTLA